MTSGKSFGEMALINDANRAATIHCLTECYFAVIKRDDYTNLLARLEHK